MDSLRITLLIVGAILIALVYAWERLKRRKENNRYARWGVTGDETETHIIGRNSGDPETDVHLVSTAYEKDSSVQYTPQTELSGIDNSYREPEEESYVDTPVVNNTNQPLDEPGQIFDDEPDLDADPEAVNPIEDITSELEALEDIIAQEPQQDEMDLGDLELADEAQYAEPDKIIAIHVLAREGHVFSGTEIMDCVRQLGLHFGDMDIFHRLDSNGHSIFSLANAIEPGVFDLSAMDEMSTPALLLIMSLPNPVAPLEAYDSMLDTARALTDSLNGRLCDETRSVLTRQAIDAQRDELKIL